MICIGQRDESRTFVWCRSNQAYKDDFLKKTSEFHKPFMLFNRSEEIAIIASTINAYVYIEILFSFHW